MPFSFTDLPAVNTKNQSLTNHIHDFMLKKMEILDSSILALLRRNNFKSMEEAENNGMCLFCDSNPTEISLGIVSEEAPKFNETFIIKLCNQKTGEVVDKTVVELENKVELS